jgi:hypothetical protein
MGTEKDGGPPLGWQHVCYELASKVVSCPNNGHLFGLWQDAVCAAHDQIDQLKSWIVSGTVNIEDSAE